MFTYTHDAKLEKRLKQLLKQLVEIKTDNVLEPHRASVLEPDKGEPILQDKESMGPGKEKVLFIDEDVEIFASYVPSKHQINVLREGLKQHNAKYLKTIEYSCDRITAILKYGEKSIAGIYGFSYETTLTVVDFQLAEEDPKVASMALKCMLDQLEPHIKTIYMSELPRDSRTIKTLSVFGFHIEETGSYNKINAWTTVEELKIALKQYGPAPLGVSSVINRLEHYGQDFSESESKGTKEFEASIKQFNLNFTKGFSEQAEQSGQNDEDEFSPNDRFMFLVQKKDKQIVGGVLCKTEETQLHVEELWLHTSMRRKKLSEKLVDLAEQYAKQKGCTTAGVETTSYQAPWLYPRLGYKQVSSLKMGPYTGFYYKKQL